VTGMASINKTARNEQRKITATAINNLAVSLIVTGVIVPVLTLVYQFTSPQATYWIGVALLCTVAGLVFHAVSRHLLRRIEE
jgi:hypothetical protein